MKAILAGVLFTPAVILQLTSARSRQSGLSFALLMASCRNLLRTNRATAATVKRVAGAPGLKSVPECVDKPDYDKSR
jgi:hypothetical protein